jgi:hypothetical protein
LFRTLKILWSMNCACPGILVEITEVNKYGESTKIVGRKPDFVIILARLSKVSECVQWPTSQTRETEICYLFVVNPQPATPYSSARFATKASGRGSGVDHHAPQGVCIIISQSTNQLYTPHGLCPGVQWLVWDMARYLGVWPNKELRPEILRYSAPQPQADQPR